MKCTNGCCGTISTNPHCPICIGAKSIIKLLNVRGKIRFRDMTDDEFQKYHAPIFECDEDCTCDRIGTDPHKEGCKAPIIVGFLPVAKRVFFELFLPPNTNYGLYGSTITKNLSQKV